MHMCLPQFTQLLRGMKDARCPLPSLLYLATGQGLPELGPQMAIYLAIYIVYQCKGAHILNKYYALA
jgi:hypothetical protein